MEIPLDTDFVRMKKKYSVYIRFAYKNWPAKMEWQYKNLMNIAGNLGLITLIISMMLF